MIFYWAMPRHREPLWIEYLIDDILYWVWKKLVFPLYDTRFEYWLLDPDGQFYTLCLATILGTTTWYLISRESSHTTMRAARLMRPEANVTNAEQDQSVNQAAYAPLIHKPTLMRTLAPVDHRPTNAHLEGSPFRVAHSLSNAERTGRLSTPGYQTPFGITTHARNFASLAQDAPVNYETLQEIGMLNWDGTPTKKWTEKQEVRGTSSGKGKGKEPVAYWANEMGKKGRRAVVLREVDANPGFLDESEDEELFP